MSTDDEIRSYVQQLTADDPRTAAPAASEFDIAVQKLVSAGINAQAARQLINNAVDRPGSLSSWADHLVEQRRRYDELERRFPRGGRR